MAPTRVKPTCVFSTVKYVDSLSSEFFSAWIDGLLYVGSGIQENADSLTTDVAAVCCFDVGVNVFFQYHEIGP